MQAAPGRLQLLELLVVQHLVDLSADLLVNLGDEIIDDLLIDRQPVGIETGRFLRVADGAGDG